MFTDAECDEGAEEGVEDYSWALAAAPGALPDCALITPHALAVGHGRGGVCGTAGTVCVRVQWQQCHGMWGSLSDTVCQDWRDTSDCKDQPVFALLQPAGAQATWRVWRVDPDIPDVGCVRAGAGAGVVACAAGT